MSAFKGRTFFITGASRGIGKAIGLRVAREGANVIIAAKTDKPHPKLPGTVHTAAAEMEEAGGKALAVVVDVRFEDQVRDAVARGVEAFGGIDCLINNASAISLTNTAQTTMKRYDLMHQVNTRGTYLCTAVCAPHLREGSNPHVLNVAPPLSMDPKWFKNHLAYTMAKYGMGMCVLGHSEEFRRDGIAVNALWPRTAIATAAIDLIGGEAMRSQSRNVEIMADAAAAILARDAASCTGNFFIDEDVLREEGVTDFDGYAIDPSKSLVTDFFLD
jgi:citronellol/citronellal dehydrogenase